MWYVLPFVQHTAIIVVYEAIDVCEIFFFLNLRQSWLPAFWKKIQNTQEIKRTLFNKMEQDKTCFVLFRLIKKHSFNLLCVLVLFSERWQSTLSQIFFFFSFLLLRFANERSSLFFSFFDRQLNTVSSKYLSSFLLL